MCHLKIILFLHENSIKVVENFDVDENKKFLKIHESANILLSTCINCLCSLTSIVFDNSGKVSIF